MARKIENGRRFQCCERHKLYEVVLYHIAQGSGTFIESATSFDTQILYGCNLHIVYIITVP